jgi:hypothetical protein
MFYVKKVRGPAADNKIPPPFSPLYKQSTLKNPFEDRADDYTFPILPQTPEKSQAQRIVVSFLYGGESPQSVDKQGYSDKNP